MAGEQFTADELAQIKKWAEDAAISAEREAKGAYEQFYLNVRELILDKISTTTRDDMGNTIRVMNPGADPELVKTCEWLLGGSQVNAGVGIFSAMIRQYANEQGILRYGHSFTEDELAKASNAVAAAVAQQIDDGHGLIPTVFDIGTKDLLVLRDTLFAPDKDGELKLNQAWPGILLLTTYGTQEGTFASRLLQEYSTTDPVAFDNGLNLKNALYAWESLSHAVDYVHNNLGQLSWEDPTRNSLIADAQWFRDPYNPVADARGLLEHFLKNVDPATAQVMRAISGLGSSAVLDELRKLYIGDVVWPTTPTTFADNAREFFNAYDVTTTPMVSLFGMSANEMVGYALRNDDTGLAYRYALVNGNGFAVLDNASVYAKHNAQGELNVALADGDAGQLSLAYLEDRSKYLEGRLYLEAANLEHDVAHREQGILNVDLWPSEDLRNRVYSDLPSHYVINQLSYQIGDRALVVFGGDNDDPINGLSKGDHLYGGEGKDIIHGNGGDDYIEGGAKNDALYGDDGNDVLVGGAGDDTLEGGEGRDTLVGGDGADTLKGGNYSDVLVGGKDDDVLNGGAGRDLLQGGEGDDEYQFTTADMKTATDVISDSDHIGHIKIDGTDATFEGITALDERTWITQDGVKLTKNDVPVLLSFADATAQGVVGQLKNFFVAPAVQEVTGQKVSQLTITFKNGTSIAIQNFQDGEFGISLPEFGGRQAGTGMGVSGTTDASGVTWFAMKYDPNSVVVGTAGKDRIIGYDPLGYSVWNGTALIHAGAGDDYYLSNGTAAVAYGEDGADRLVDYPAWELEMIDGQQQFYIGGNRTYGVVPQGVNHNDYFDGGNGDDLLEGNLGDDRLYGGAGRDVVIGGTGDDYLDGGADQDFLLGDWSLVGSQLRTRLFDEPPGGQPSTTGDYGITINPDGSVTTMNWFWAEPTWAVLPDGSDEIHAGAGDDYAWGGGGDDTIFGDDGADYLWGGTGDDMVDGGVGADHIDAGDGSDLVLGGDDDDVIRAGTGEDFLFGDAGNDELYGDEGDDRFFGGDGDDTLEGGAGADQLEGGSGNDTYVIHAGDSTDTIIDYSGTDTLRFVDGSLSSTVLIARESDNLILTNELTNNFVTIVDWYRDPNNRIESIEFADGRVFTAQEIEALIESSAGNEKVTDGTAGDDAVRLADVSNNFFAADGNDVVYLGGGGDQGSGGLGNDTLSGGDGDDTLFGDEGDDTLYGDAGDDNVYGGAGNDVLLGGAGSDVLYGEEGNDTLVGGAGHDFLVGGSGDDTYVMDADNDTVIENQNGGIDTVQTELTYTLPGGVENLTLVGFDAISGEGNELDNWLTGNGAANILVGGAGIDTIFAGDGADTLIGGDGDDHLVGENGNDILDGGAGSDTLWADAGYDGPAGDDVLYGGDGNDTLYGGVGDDVLDGGADDDTMYGGDGNDSLDGGAGNDTSRGGNGDDILSGGLGDDWLIAGTGDDQINGGEGNDQLSGGAGRDYLDGGAGDDIMTGETDDDVMFGGEGADRLWGNDGNDHLDGGAGDDRLKGGNGNDVYVAGVGDDVLIDSGGDDTYLFGAGDGIDYVIESDGLDAIIFDATVFDSDIIVSRNEYDDLLLSNKNGIDSITVAGWFQDDWSKIETVQFSSGVIWSIADIEEKIRPPNTSPVVQNALVDQVAIEDEGFNYAVPENAFVDFDAGDTLLITAAKDDGQALPSWLSFDAATQTFSGTPTNGDVGAVTLKVTATDSAGAAVSSSFTVNIVNTNDAPIVANAITDQSASEDAAFSYVVPENAFADVDAGDALSFTATQADGSALPSWLSFDAQTRTFSGTPTNGDVGVIALTLTATDSAGASVSSSFAVNVVNTNDAPIVANAIADQAAIEDAAFSFVVPVNTFADVDAGDKLSFTATQADGSALPSWLNFDAMTQTFGGTPTNGDVGAVTLTVTATDSAGASTTSSFTVNVANTNDAPIVANAIADQAATEDAAFSYVVPANTFADVDAGDTLSLMATQADGSALPSWLNFDVMTQTFSGTPTNGDVGVVTLTVTATDGAGASISSSFTVNVANTNDAPIVASPLADQNATEGAAFSFVMPSNSFTDVDVGDVLTYSATKSDGSALPSWLTFNAATATFSGTPTESDVGTLTLNVVAADSAGASATDQFVITIKSSFNFITGTSANDTLTGTAGKDYIDGLAGADSMSGKAGDDTYIVDNTGDVVTENANEGTDTIRSSVTYTLGTNVENLVLTGTSAINGTGNTLNNVLTGNSANNTLSGGTGADTMIGGAGNDTYVVDNVSDVVTENANEGTDLVQSSVTYTLSANVENLTLTGTTAINGTGNDLANTLTGNSAANTLTGGAGDDALNGGTGNDTMIGGTGNDTYVLDVATDIVTENANEGTDTVQIGVTYTLGNNVENLTLTGTTAINGTGNALNNVLTGNSAANTLTGGAGDDTLNGGAGNDTMVGGTGNDTYVLDVTTDIVTENANEGTDTVQIGATYTLGSNVENLTLTGTSAINGTGNTLNNVLTGNSANNTLSGGTGADTMRGGAGNDTYVVDNVGDVVTENANEGSDLVQSSVTYTLAANVENLTLTGTTAINGTGNDLANSITGNSAANTLTGGAGNDTLNGGTGSDTMIGGTGNDTYVLDVATDIVTENANEGTDTVQIGVTYTLGNNVENLTLTGTSAINGTGNALNNVLTGNSAVNTLTGGAGDDTLIGGAGNDTLKGGTGNDTYVLDVTTDVVTENANEGTDTVQIGATYTLGSNVENLTLTGTSAINGTGNTLNNVLTGNSAVNTLTGGAGDDTLIGGAGNDTLVGGTGNDTYVLDVATDVVTENTNEGTDTVQIGVTYTLGNNVENLTLTGTSAINGTGNALNNVLIGNDAANALSGGAGNDTLNGGLGNDTLDGGAGDDTYLLNRGNQVETVNQNDATSTNDTAQFGSDVAQDQVWLQHVGNDLQVSIIGNGDQFTFKNWYSGTQYHVDRFVAGSGAVLLDAQVETLVSAMAAFNPPPVGQTTLTTEQHAALDAVIAASWK